jgi:hypothetical protein
MSCTYGCTSGVCNTCSPGSTGSCTDSSGCSGTRTCSSSGSWGSCAKTDSCCGVSCSANQYCVSGSCKYVDITSASITSSALLGNSVTVTIYYNSNFNGNVDFAIDLIKDYGSYYCHKLHCGAPGSDTECHPIGCDGGHVFTSSVSSGNSNSLSITFTLPSNGQIGTYSLFVGAWKTTFTQKYDSIQGNNIVVNKCTEGWLSNTQCRGELFTEKHVVQQKWQKADCSTEWRDKEDCNSNDGYHCNGFGTNDREWWNYYCYDYSGSASCWIDNSAVNAHCWGGCSNGDCKATSVTKCEWTGIWPLNSKTGYEINGWQYADGHFTWYSTYGRYCPAMSGWYCQGSSTDTIAYTTYDCYENFDSTGSCAAMSTQNQFTCNGGAVCNPGSAYCKNVDIKSVSTDKTSYKLGETARVTITYQANFAGNVDFAVDLLDDSQSPCYKLYCGSPSNDHECGTGGCQTGQVFTKTVSNTGTGTTTITFDVPLTSSGKGGNFKVIVGAWKNPTSWSSGTQYDVAGMNNLINVNCHTTTLGSAGYCRSTCQCDVGEGGCSTNADCKNQRVCVSGVGAKYGFGSNINVCEPDCASQNGCQFTNNKWVINYNSYYDPISKTCKAQTQESMPADGWYCTTSDTKAYVDFTGCSNSAWLKTISSQYNCDQLGTGGNIGTSTCIGDTRYNRTYRIDYDCSMISGTPQCTQDPVESFDTVDYNSGYNCNIEERWICNGNYREKHDWGCSQSASPPNCIDKGTVTAQEYCNYGCTYNSNTGDAECKRFEITSIDFLQNVKAGSKQNITVNYFAFGINSVTYAVDLIKGIVPNCNKLFCGSPSTDSQCNGGCLTGKLYENKSTGGNGYGSIKLEVVIDSNGTLGDYNVIVGAYKTAYSEMYNMYTSPNQMHVQGRCYGIICSNSCVGSIFYRGACNETNGACDLIADSDCSMLSGTYCSADNTSLATRSYSCISSGCNYTETKNQYCWFGCYAPSAACKGVDILGFTVSNSTPQNTIELNLLYNSIGIDGTYPFTFELSNSTNALSCHNETAKCNCRWEPMCTPKPGYACILGMWEVCDNCTKLVCNTTGVFFNQIVDVPVASGQNTISLDVPLPQNMTEGSYSIITSIWQTLQTTLFDIEQGRFDVMFLLNSSAIGFLPMSGTSGSGQSGSSQSLVIVAVGIAIAGVAALGAIAIKGYANNPLSDNIEKLRASLAKIDSVIRGNAPSPPTVSELGDYDAAIYAPVETSDTQPNPYQWMNESFVAVDDAETSIEIRGEMSYDVDVGLPQSYVDAVTKEQQELVANMQKKYDNFVAKISSLTLNDLANLSEAERIDMFIMANEFGLGDLAAILGSRDSIQSLLPPKPQPITPPVDISNRPWWQNVGEGWSMALGNAWNGITGFAGNVWNGITTWAQDPIGNTVNGLNNLVNATKDFIEGAVNYAYNDPIGAVRWVSGIALAPMTGGASLLLIPGAPEALWNAGTAYVTALVNDPIGTLAKTVITIAGGILLIASIVGAPFTGGASLLLTGVAVAAIAGAGALVLQDSYEYATSETSDELQARANENTENIAWEIGGFLTGAQGLSMAAKINAFRQIASASEWAPESLSGHFAKHVINNADEATKWSRLGVTTESQYAQVAREVISSGKPFTYVQNGKKMIGFYDEARNIFVAVNQDGRIATTFIPREGISYINGLQGMTTLTTKSPQILQGGYKPPTTPPGGLAALDVKGSSAFISRYPEDAAEISKLANNLGVTVRVSEEVAPNEIHAIKEILKNAKNAEDASATLRQMGYAGRTVELVSFEKIPESASAIWEPISKNTAKIRFDPELVSGRPDNHLFDLTRHEFMHSFTTEIETQMTAKLPQFARQGDMMSFVAKNEAQDLLTLQFIGKVSSAEKATMWGARLEKLESTWPSIKLAEEIANNAAKMSPAALERELTTLNALMNYGTDWPELPFVSEWMTMKGNSGTIISRLIEATTKVKNPALAYDLMGTINEMQQLTESYGEVMNIV